MKSRNTDLIGGVFLILTAVFFWTKMGRFTPYAKIFPQAILILLSAAGIGLVIKGLIKPSKAKLFVLDQRSNAILIGAISLAWVLLMNVIGFVVTSIVALSLLFWILNDKRNIRSFGSSLVIATGEVAALYLVFSKVLYVPFPQGIFF